MSMFQKSVEKKYLNELDSSFIENKYADFQNYFGNPERQKNIRNAKEEQFQEGFLRELFVNIFGYTLNPELNFNLTTELKNISNSRKADGAILKNENAHAVIELKSTNTTDLDSIETQAFGYKNHHPKCVYVITSNFEKLRFYIQNAVDHIDFDLFNLTREQFSLMWLCLAKENLLNDLPLKIKDSSVLQEENITKKLYADYSRFRTAIFNNLIKNNIDTDKLLLFKKTQKLLDRFLFIFFAEDRLLLPPNSISEIVKQWTTLKDELDEYVPLYARFKKYFGYMNTGFKGKKYDIYAYNGGLFKPDEILDNILIDDDILHEHTIKLSNYDFETDVDVNILGHIFEHSLGEIENVQAEIKGEKVDSQKTRRKKDGIFYTPKYITKYIVENTVGKLCNEKRNELQIIDEDYAKGRKNRKKEIVRTLDKKLDDYRNWLLTLTILDPACGSGAFLNQALEFLINEHQKIDELRTQLFGGAIVFSDITTDILEKNIFGVDLNEESVEIAKLSLWLRTAQKGRKLNTLSNNIKCGNSLIDDPEIAGDKAFNWHNEFPHIFSKKKKKAWHITTAIHNSRYSQRMLDYHIKTDDASWLSENDEILITEIIAGIIKEDKLNVVEYNICGDHMHLLLICEEKKLTKIVGKIKAVSAREYNIKKGYTIPKGKSESDITRGHVPLSDTDTEAKKEKKKYNSLWTQKFGKGEIKDDEYLNNAIEYIRNNRTKHKLPISERIEKIKEEFLCTKEHAFRTEYTGGFDVVIGNPPYVPTEYIHEHDKIYLEKTYQSAFGRINLFPVFYEKGLLVLKQDGLLSFITPYTILKNQYYKEARKYILEKSTISVLVDFKGITVFEDAAVDSIILTLRKKLNDNNKFTSIFNIKDFQTNQYQVADTFQNDILKSDDLSFNVSLNDKLIKRISKNCKSLKEIINFNQGIITGGNKKFITPVKSELTKKIITGSDFNRYSIVPSDNYIIYDKEKLHRPRKKEIFEVQEKILLRQTGAYPICAIDTERYYTLDTVHNGLLIDSNYDLKYLLTLLNSKLLRFLYENSINESGKVFAQVKIIYIDPLPIRIVGKEEQEQFISLAELIISESSNLTNLRKQFINLLLNKYEIGKLSKKLQNWYEIEFKDFLKELKKAKIELGLSEEAEWMLYFNEQKEKAQIIKSEIEKTDKEIDQMVYELYGLSEEEIKIVEGTTK